MYLCVCEYENINKINRSEEFRIISFGRHYNNRNSQGLMLYTIDRFQVIK